MTTCFSYQPLLQLSFLTFGKTATCGRRLRLPARPPQLRALPLVLIHNVSKTLTARPPTIQSSRTGRQAAGSAGSSYVRGDGDDSGMLCWASSREWEQPNEPITDVVVDVEPCDVARLSLGVGALGARRPV